MVSWTVLGNLACYVLLPLVLAHVIPAPIRQMPSLVRSGVEYHAMPRRLIAGSVALLAIVLLGPAVLGIAPLPSHSPERLVELSGLAYPGLAIGGVLGLSGVLGSLRLRRAVDGSSRVDLERPPQVGPAVVTGTVRRAERLADGGATDDEFHGLVHDYRRSVLDLDDTAEAAISETGQLRRVRPFLLEGPGTSIRVDPAEADLGITGEEAVERRIEEGDDVTVIGTVGTTADGRRELTGEDSLLYLTPNTPAELRRRLRRSIYGGGAVSLVFLVLAGLVLHTLAG